MPIRLNKKRHPDILRLLAQRQQVHDQSNNKERKSLLPAVLDGLNAYSQMERTARRTPSQKLCFGPASISNDGWLGIVIWYRPKTYHAYKPLNVLGIWGIIMDESIRIHVGMKTLDYLGHPYNVDAYRHRMRTEFETYYGTLSTPPNANSCLYTITYTPENRLDIRAKLQSVLSNYWSIG